MEPPLEALSRIWTLILIEELEASSVGMQSQCGHKRNVALCVSAA